MSNNNNSKAPAAVSSSKKVAGITDDQNKKRDNVLALIKSLLNSAQGDLTVDQLERDYLQMVDEPIPYKQLHHVTLATFLQSAPQVIQVVNRSGRMYVRTASTAKDHISALVSGQRPVVKRRQPTRFGAPPMRRPTSYRPSKALLPNPSLSPYKWNNNNRNFRPNQAYRPLINPPPLLQHLTTDGSVRSYGKADPKKQQQRRPLLGFGGRNSPQPVVVNPANVNLNPQQRTLIPQRQVITPDHGVKTAPPQLKSPPRLQLSNSGGGANTSKYYYASGNINTPRAQRTSLPQNVSFNNEVPPRLMDKSGTGSSSAKQELEQLAKEMGYGPLIFRTVPLQKNWLATVEVNGVRYKSYPEERATVEGAEALVAAKALEGLKEQRRAEGPVTQDFELCLRRVKELLLPEQHGVWLSHLRERYQAHHHEALPQDFCEQAHARKGGGLQLTRHQQLWIVNCDRSNSDLSSSTPGQQELSHQSLPAQLTVAPQSLLPCPPAAGDQPQSLPPLQARPPPKQFSVRSLAPIVLPSLIKSPPPSPVILPQQAVTPVQSPRAQSPPAAGITTPLQSPTPSMLSLQSQSSIISNDSTNYNDANNSNIAADTLDSCTVVTASDPCPPPLVLPQEDHLDVYVSHVTDDNKICFRLLLDQFNDAYEELMTQMELHYYGKSNCTAPQEIVLGCYYVLYHDETWYRIQATAVTESSVCALFVDHGDSEEVEREHVYELLPAFLELPCQHVAASLSGLEGLNCDALTTALQTSVLGQSLVAHVTQRTTPEEQSTGASPLQVELIDTSSDDDVNVNEKLLDLLPDSFTKPQLPQVDGIAEVFLTSVRKDGRLYVTIESETYTMLEHMLATAKIKAEELSESAVSEIDLTKLYLARFAADNDWHRVRPKSGSVGDKVTVECIDWGMAEEVSLACVRPLTSLAPVLCLLPPQALECVLANVPPSSPAGLKWTKRATARLEEVQPPTGPILLKTVGTSSEGVPQVLLFKRLQPTNELISINETLAMDTKLFAGDDECNNNENNNGTGNKTPSALSTPVLHPPALPSVGDMYDVYVTYAANPANFAVQSCDSYTKLEQLRREMQGYYSSSDDASSGQAREDAILQLDDIEEGGYYAALHTDGYWYRVLVGNMSRRTDVISGVFVDFGDCFVSSSSNMRRLLPCFAELPQQSIKASLAGIIPVNGDWMPEDTCWFRTLTQEHEFVSYVLGIAMDLPPATQPSLLSAGGGQQQQKGSGGSTRLLLKLVDTSEKEKDVYIDELMVKEGKAVFVQKQNALEKGK